MKKDSKILSEISPPLIYVWLGSEVPNYAVHSLNATKKRSSLNVVMLSNAPRPRGLNSEIKWLSTSSFYNPQAFSVFKFSSPMDPEFRDGFWMSVSERFFVLRDFIASNNLTRFFHAELDVMVFNLEGLSIKLDNYGKGMFVPRDRKDKFVASLIYVNDDEIIGQLCDELIANADAGIEMYIIKKFADENKDKVFALPSGPAMLFGANVLPWDSIDENKIGGVIDAADFGRYLFGLDPRNSEHVVRNQYLDEFEGRHSIYDEFYPVPYPIPLHFNKTLGNLEFHSNKGEILKVYGVHVHSKKIRLFSSNRALEILITKHNKGIPSIISYNFVPRAKRILRSIPLLRTLKQLFNCRGKTV